MARKQRKTGKGRNGVGTSVTVYFDTSDPREKRAMQMAQLLASKQPGKRKDAIVELFAALYDDYEATGALYTPGSIAGALVSNGPRPAMGFTSVVSRHSAGTSSSAFLAGMPVGTPSGIAIMELPSGHMFDDSNEPLIQVVDAQPQRASAEEIAYNMAQDMGNLFDD
jgi:hypothetical protein